MKNIYVGNLPFSSTEDEVRDLFAQYGEVLADLGLWKWKTAARTRPLNPWTVPPLAVGACGSTKPVNANPVSPVR